MPKLITGGFISATLTYACDLRCRYCLRDAGPTKLAQDAGRRDMPLDLFQELLRYAADVGYAGIGLTGGEVALYPHLFEVLELVDSLGWRPLIETNGFTRSHELLDGILARCTPSIMPVSLDSRDPAVHDKLRGRGSWALAVDTVRRLVAAGVPVRVHAMVTPYNLHEEREVVEFVQWARDDLGASEASFGRVVDSGRGTDQLRWELSPQKKLWFRELLDRHQHWGGFVGHTFHYRDRRPQGGGEHNLDCQRLLASELNLSPNGFHPCIFQQGIVLAPLEDYQRFITTPDRGNVLNYFRRAALEDESPATIVSCAECTVLTRRFLQEVQGWEISGVEVQPAAPRVHTALLRAAVPRRPRRVPVPQALLIVPSARGGPTSDHELFPGTTAGPELTPAVLDVLLRQAQFLGVRRIVYGGLGLLASERVAELLALPARYGLPVELLATPELLAARRGELTAAREGVARLWMAVGGLRQPPPPAAALVEAAQWALAQGWAVGVWATPGRDGLAALLPSLQRLRRCSLSPIVGARGLLPDEPGGLDPALREALQELQQAHPDLLDWLDRLEAPSTVDDSREAGWPAVAIDATGRVHPCPSSLLLPGSHPWPLPTLPTTTLYDALADLAPVQAQLATLHGRHGGRRLAPFGFCRACLARLQAPAGLDAPDPPDAAPGPGRPPAAPTHRRMTGAPAGVIFG